MVTCVLVRYMYLFHHGSLGIESEDVMCTSKFHCAYCTAISFMPYPQQNNSFVQTSAFVLLIFNGSLNAHKYY